jgi:hypothetical protein
LIEASYQTSQRAPFARTIGDPALHANVVANSVRFDSGPSTRYFGGE